MPTKFLLGSASLSRRHKSIQIRTLFPFYLRRITVVIEKLKKAFSKEIMVRIPIENINLSLLFNDIKHVSCGQMNKNLRRISWFFRAILLFSFLRTALSSNDFSEGYV